jgi:ubiquinone/menaquinone biosynthesis C-methylase UbiE
VNAETWDYTNLASSYSFRPSYAPQAVDRIVAVCAREHPRAADIGAGTGHLTVDLAARGCDVDAVEPNEAMRTVGRERTTGSPRVRWWEGTAEATGLPQEAYELVTFGSSFNTTDRPLALRESARLLRDGGWIACLWNHRVLSDPLQAEIEDLIQRSVPGYAYGARREDQEPIIETSGLFGPVTKLEEPIRHRMAVDDWMVAWRSHATLQRQAGHRFVEVVQAIKDLLDGKGLGVLEVPYVTVGWIAPRRRRAQPSADSGKIR